MEAGYQPEEIFNCRNDDMVLFWGIVVVVNLCFTSLFGTKDLLSDIVIR